MENTGTYLSNLILQSKLSQREVKLVVEALKTKKYVLTAVLPDTPESITFGEFLELFWNFDKSPYVKEKVIFGQSIHRRYTDIMLSRCKRYWIPFYGKKLLGEVTRFDLKENLHRLAENYGLQKETVNQIMRSVTCALKWAYNNELIQKDVCKGLVFLHVVNKEREVLSYKEALSLFEAEWKDFTSKIANLTAMCTGLRMGEVLALRLCDLGDDCIYVRHSWARGEGLKCPKNGEERFVKVNPLLINILIKNAKKNAGVVKEDAFVFGKENSDSPMNGIHWNESLKSEVKKLGINKHITFHSWRHFFATQLLNDVDEHKVMVATGHKSQDIFEHYAHHVTEEALQEVFTACNKLFLPAIKSI